GMRPGPGSGPGSFEPPQAAMLTTRITVLTAATHRRKENKGRPLLRRGREARMDSPGSTRAVFHVGVPLRPFAPGLSIKKCCGATSLSPRHAEAPWIKFAFAAFS